MRLALLVSTLHRAWLRIRWRDVKCPHCTANLDMCELVASLKRLSVWLCNCCGKTFTVPAA